MTNFIKRVVGGIANNQGGCCGVEIKEVLENEQVSSSSCCSTDETTVSESSCCGTDTSSSQSSCCAWYL